MKQRKPLKPERLENYAYRVARRLNPELEEKGCLVVKDRVSADYFAERFFNKEGVDNVEDEGFLSNVMFDTYETGDGKRVQISFGKGDRTVFRKVMRTEDRPSSSRPRRVPKHSRGR